MIRYKPREEDGYAGTSLIAGFIEVGETIEDAVRREVMEEAGLKVSNIRYYKSQPWGFASNLMIGVICDLDGSDEIAVQDTNEVAEAVWIPRDEIQVYDNGVSLTFEMIARFKNGEL
jgi:NAD+ diphosphatase